jgi:hypothetical protein
MTKKTAATSAPARKGARLGADDGDRDHAEDEGLERRAGPPRDGRPHDGNL